jgi:beta-lactamase regulating signal transducer with metallopeptidase domain
MLGHEIAHHKRLDPVRLGLMNLMRGIFFFQPFLRVAERDVHWAAEEPCDEWSADHVEESHVSESENEANEGHGDEGPERGDEELGEG